MPSSKLPKAWQHLKLSKQRKHHDLPWINWGDIEPEDEGEPSTLALELNAPMVHVMFEQLQSLQVPEIKTSIRNVF